ncbi:MAG TPA: hypothetical protein VGH99_19705 [Pseudonocardia sp.]
MRGHRVRPGLDLATPGLPAGHRTTRSERLSRRHIRNARLARAGRGARRPGTERLLPSGRLLCTERRRTTGRRTTGR